MVASFVDTGLVVYGLVTLVSMAASLADTGFVAAGLLAARLAADLVTAGPLADSLPPAGLLTPDLVDDDFVRAILIDTDLAAGFVTPGPMAAGLMCAGLLATSLVTDSHQNIMNHGQILSKLGKSQRLLYKHCRNSFVQLSSIPLSAHSFRAPPSPVIKYTMMHSLWAF